MRSLLFAGLMCAAIAGTALAQYGGQYGGGGYGSQGGGYGSQGGGRPQGGASHGGGQGQGGAQGGQGGHGASPPPPPPPPIPRCPDLAISTYAYVSAIPNAPALAGDEVAIQYEVRNAGTAPYIAGAGAQSLTLSYTTPGGPHQIASMALPPAANGQAVAPRSVELGPQQTWIGYLRAALTPADRRWPLHLRVDYGAGALNTRGLANDCNTNNNDIVLARP